MDDARIDLPSADVASLVTPLRGVHFLCRDVRDIGTNTYSPAVSESLDPNGLNSAYGASGTTCPE